MNISPRCFMKAVFFVSSLLIINSSMAATLTVTNLNDSGAGSLRQAISDAVSGDRITFDVSGTIFVSSRMHITKSLSLIGPRSGFINISGDGNTRIFHLHSGLTVTMRGLTIRDGFSDFDSTGDVGGAIENYGDLTLLNMTLERNGALIGGAIYNQGTLNMVNTTIGNNSVSDPNADCNGDGQGGGIYTEGDISIVNSSLVNNFGECGGTIYLASGTVSIVNSIISTDLALTRASCYNLTGPVQLNSQGNNISNDDSCGLTHPTDLINTDPMLGGLEINGGPVRTYNPLPGSPAIDAGADSFAPSFDAHGTRRPQGLASDIGAAEIISIAP